MQAPRPGLQRVLRLLALIGLLGQLLTGLVSAQTPAGDWTCRTNWNCTANDVNATNFRLRDYSDGPLAACTPGEPVSAYIWADVTNGTSAARTAPRVSADYALSTAPGELFQLESCVLHPVQFDANAEDVPARIGQITWTCGADMTIVDGIVAWTPNNATCDLNQSMCNGDYPPAKCARLTGLSVLAPLVADFTATTPCLGAPTEFSDTTQGGQEPYSYEWSFGDGTTSTVADPTHTYASAGSHVVTFTVTDSQTPPVVDTQTYSVTVNPNPEASITPSSAVLTCDNPSVTLTASAAGTGGSYLWSTGATTAAITVSSPGNYTVTVKNAFGCSDTASATVTEHKPVDIRVQKSANPTSVPETGGDVAFTYSVFNDGCTSAKITSLKDDKFGTLAGDEDCKVGTWLAGGADCTFNATFAVPAGDALDTHVDVFTATAEDSQGLTDTATASASVGYTDVQPTVSLAKEANPSNMSEPGGAFAYTLTITNTSDEEVWITDLEDTYPLSDECLALVEDNTSLAPDASISCDYTVTHTDAGTYSNTATVTVMDDEENPASDTASAQVTVADVPPTITVAKTANPSVVPETGGEVTYSVTVTNTSAEPVTLGSLIDDRFGHLSGQGTCTTGGDIAVDMSYTCSFTKTLSSPSLTPHTNVVTATAYDDEENPATETAEATVWFDDEPPAIEVTKTASPTTLPETGGDVTYTVVVANTGSEDVTLQSLTDSVFGDLNGQGTCATGVAIAEDDSYSCEFTWQLSSDTLTAHRNIVTATVVDDDNTPATDSDDATVTFEDVKPAISVVKTASPTVVPETGGDVTFTFRVENTGTEAVTIVSLDDSVYGPLAGDADCAVGMVLDADESCEFTITDRVQGVFGGPDHVNTFTAVAEDNEANDATASDDATVQFSDVEATISVAKSATPASATVGDEIRYDYVVTNSGLMNLMMVTLGDDLLGQVPLFTDPALTQPYVDGTLAPGESLYGVMTYMVVESDLPEPIVNVALADALSEYQEPVSAEDTASVDLTYTKGLSLVKTASVDGADVGEEILYTYTIRNTGNVTLSNLALTDDVLGTIALSVTTLAPGASTTATATHVVVEGDLPGPLVNEATATAFTRLQEPVSAKDTATVLLGAHPALAIVKTGPESPQEMGAVLDYEIVVTNTGDVTLTNVTVTDALLGISKTFPSLAPGASQTVEGTYTVTEADIPEGFTAEDTSFDIVNVATADSDQTGPVSDDWSVTVNYEFYIPLLGLAIEKTGPAAAEVGDTILYTIVVTNTGETDLADVVVTDAKLGLMETIALLAAGEAKTFTGSYGPVTEEDLPGPIENTATASQAQVGEVQDTWTVPVGTNPGLSITKSGPASVAIGGTIPYTIVVQNTGDVTLVDVRVVDSKLGLDVTIVSLAPGETKTFTPSYGPVSEGDLPGPIENTATASHPATGTVQDSWEVAIVTGPALAIAKTGPDQAVEVGDTITYRLVVTNVGDVTLHHVVVEDARLGFAETVAALAPGEAREFVLEYTVGEGDLTSELLIHNVATADADETEPVSDEHTVPIKDFEQEIEPCVRSDVAVIIYGGWNGLPVRAWAAGAEQAVQHTALNAFGEPQATWTFWPGEGETFTVTVAPELPAELDGARWSYQALSSPTVSFGRCQARTIYFQLMDNGTPSPTPVPPVPSLPQTGASGLGQEALRAALIAVGLAWLLLAGAWLLRRRLPIAGKGR